MLKASRNRWVFSAERNYNKMIQSFRGEGFAISKNLRTLNRESSKNEHGAYGRKYAKSQEESESSYTLKKSGEPLELTEQNEGKYPQR